MPLEQTGNSLVFYALFTASKLGLAGLTVTVNVNRGGTNLVNGASAAAVDATNLPGLYAYTLASGSNTAEGEYIARFTTADTTVDQRDVYAAWYVAKAGMEDLDAAISSRSTVTTAQVNTEVDTALADYDGPTHAELTAELATADDAVLAILGTPAGADLAADLAAIKAETGTIGAASVTVTAPVAASGTITLVRGDTYATADGRELSWTDSGGTWPNLTGATLVLAIAATNGVQTITTVTCTNPGTANQVVQATLTAIETAGIGGNNLPYDLQATLASGHIITLVQGIIVMKNQVAL